MDVVRPMSRRSLLANRSDLHSAFEESNQGLIRALENELARKAATVVLYTSHALMNTEQHSLRRSELFSSTTAWTSTDSLPCAVEPGLTDLANIPRPIVGFFGGIDDYVVDLDLLKRVAEEPTRLLARSHRGRNLSDRRT